MPRPQHAVVLTAVERAELAALLRHGTSTAMVQRRARILLKADRARAPRLTDAQVADACEVAPRTVARVRAAWCARGMASLTRDQRRRPGPAALLDGAAETRVIAVACSAPPAGHRQWTLRLLADRVVELGIVPAVSRETVRRTLKKMRSSPGAPAAS
jgi:hypothetical protein